MFSLGEIESNCNKAARGAGLSWGVAQECGLIARHLTELGLPGADAVYLSLKCIHENKINELDLKFGMEREFDQLVPGVLLGIRLADQVFNYSGEDIKIAHSVVGPLGFFGVFVRLLSENFCISVSWSDKWISLGSSGLLMRGKNTNPFLVSKINCRIEKSEKRLFFPKLSKKRISIENWTNLTRLAEQTYVPSSQKSRLYGAGAQDNDSD